MLTLVIVVLVLMTLGTLPTWPHSTAWGYGPSGGLFTILVVVLLLRLTGVM